MNNVFVPEQISSNTGTVFLATVSAVDASEGLQLIFDGETTASQKHYKMLVNGSMPEVGDRVALLKTAGSYIVLGKISTGWADPHVLKAGDTMTGDLTIDDADLKITDGKIDLSETMNIVGQTQLVNVVPSGNYRDGEINFLDKARTLVARLSSFFGNDSYVGLKIRTFRTVNNSEIENVLGLYIDATGEQHVAVSSSKMWRGALGLGTSGNFPLTITQGGSGNTGTAYTTTASDIITAATNWRIDNAAYYSWGKLAMLEFNITATAALTLSSSTPIATVVSGKRPATNSSAQAWLARAYTAVIKYDGGVIMGANDTSIASGTGFTIMAAYLLP